MEENYLKVMCVYVSRSTSMQGTPTSGRTSVSMTGSVSGSLGGGSTNSNNSQSKRRFELNFNFYI
jgi:hypothetical protein